VKGALRPSNAKTAKVKNLCSVTTVYTR